VHSLDALIGGGFRVTAAFGPQHGMRGEKQYNMEETADYTDPVHKIPVYSLYGKTRRPTAEMMKGWDTVLIDLQDVGTRIYTYVATTLYVLEAAAKHDKSVWILDRPNPIGRPVEGMSLEPGQESFVGVIPVPIRHGLTLGELALYMKDHFRLDVDLQVISMKGYQPAKGPGFGWPPGLAWVNPSPQAPGVGMARAFPGTVLLEGTNLSEGRGMTRPLEVIGHPEIDFRKVLTDVVKTAPKSWLAGCALRLCHFVPTWDKEQGKNCEGLQIHVEGDVYDHQRFRPVRLMAALLKSVHRTHPKFELFREFYYEYEQGRLAFDVINGGARLRSWILDSKAKPQDLESLLKKDEAAWLQARRKFLIYK
jgi:uncharacterized protein YbbC (DUF1343 family)